MNNSLDGLDTAIHLNHGAFYAGDLRGLAASVLSLITIVVATSLVGYKAW